MKKDNDVMKEHYRKLINDAILELKTPGKRHRQIPNILTVLRLFAPVTIIPAVAMGNFPLTIGLAIGFSLTDLADGFIARNWKLTSELGKDLDALADKMFSGTLLLGASLSNPILLMNVALEMIIARINIHQKTLGKQTASTIMGKGKTWALFTLAGLGIAVPSLSGTAILNALSIGTAALQALTVGSYIKQYEEEWDNKDTQSLHQVSRMEIDSSFDFSDEKMYSKKIEPKSEEIDLVKVDDLHGDMSESSVEDTLEQLKRMSEFLHCEKNNQLGVDTVDQTNSTQVGIQKVKV